MEKIKVPSPGTDDSTSTILFPQTPEAEEIFQNAGSSYSRSDDGEDGVGRQDLFFLGGRVGAGPNTIPQTKVKGYRDNDRVENDEKPEDDYCSDPLLGLQGVIESRRLWLEHTRG